MLNTIAAFHHFLIYIINKSNKLEISALWCWSLRTNAKLRRKRVNTTLEGIHCVEIHSKFLCHCLSFLSERLLSCPPSCTIIESSSHPPSHINFYLFMVIPPSFMVLLLSLLRLLIISSVFPERVWTNLSISIMCKGLNDLFKKNHVRIFHFKIVHYLTHYQIFQGISLQSLFSLIAQGFQFWYWNQSHDGSIADMKYLRKSEQLLYYERVYQIDVYRQLHTPRLHKST